MCLLTAPAFASSYHCQSDGRFDVSRSAPLQRNAAAVQTALPTLSLPDPAHQAALQAALAGAAPSELALACAALAGVLALRQHFGSSEAQWRALARKAASFAAARLGLPHPALQACLEALMPTLLSIA
jgi:hypothetical protein